MEKRKPRLGKSTPLPLDYAKLVTELLTTNFDAQLKELSRIKGQPARFEISGEIHPDEVVFAATILFGKELAATTIAASCDFDPRASSPTVQDVLGACVDAVGSLMSQLLEMPAAASTKKKSATPSRLEQVADNSLGALEEVPFDWTPADVDRFKVFLKIDKSNPGLDALADDFLAKNDPDFQKRQEAEEAATKELFVTGPKSRDPRGVH